MYIEKTKTPVPFLEEYYISNKFHLKLLKLYILLNSDRNKIIETFNLIASECLTPDDETEFLDLVLNFSFDDNDKLCVSLKFFLNSSKRQLTILEMHCRYSPDGEGFQLALEDFKKRCLGNQGVF